MDARRILPPRVSGSRAKRIPCPCNKPGLAGSVPSPRHRSHQPASTLQSPQGLGHSIYQPTPGLSRRYSLVTSITYLQNLPRVNTTGYQAERLHDIVCDASNFYKSAIFERLSHYLRDVFPPGSRYHRPAAATHQQQQTCRQAKRKEYATTQIHWRSNRICCIKNILGDVEDDRRWNLTGQQYSHSQQLSPCLNAHHTPSRTPLRVRSKQKRSEQLEPP